MVMHVEPRADRDLRELGTNVPGTLLTALQHCMTRYPEGKAPTTDLDLPTRPVARAIYDDVAKLAGSGAPLTLATVARELNKSKLAYLLIAMTVYHADFMTTTGRVDGGGVTLPDDPVTKDLKGLGLIVDGLRNLASAKH